MRTYGSDHWRALDVRGKRSGKSKSRTPARGDVLFAPDKVGNKTKTSKPSQKTLGAGMAVSVQNPNGNFNPMEASGEGTSSATDSVKPPSGLCMVRGFPPVARVLRDGSLSY